MLIQVIPDLDPARYQRHALHAEQRIWVEKNCYVDLWIEVLHALRLEPLAMLPFTIAVDFEGDQWTFYKPSHDELRDLYGIDVQELTVWRPLLEHVLEHAPAGKLVSTEADAFWLPDTSGTDYRRQHTKTSIVINAIDVEGQTLDYFHNAGYYRLEGQDFVETFRLGKPHDPAFMPLYAEVIRLDRIQRLDEIELRRRSRSLWHKHLARVPTTNPVRRFEERFNHDLPMIQGKGLPYYHAWAFGTIRQLGSAFECAALSLEWREAVRQDKTADVSAQTTVAEICKALILKGARAANSKRPFDGTEIFGRLAEAWTSATTPVPAS